MKCKGLLLLTILLTQTMPARAMDEFELVGDITRPAQGHPKGRFNITRAGTLIQGSVDLELQNIQSEFEPFLPPHLNTLNPSDPLPQNWGTARERIRCTVDYSGNNHPIAVLLPPQYPLQGQWDFQEDRENAKNLATLTVKALLNAQRSVKVFQRQIDLPHTLIDPGVETPEGYYFDGDKVYQTRTKRQGWLNPRSQQQYTRTISVRDDDIPTHPGYHIIYVEPFAFANDLSQPKDAYRGEYNFIRDLAEDEGLPSKKDGSLIYSDGNHIYLPHLTQELWRQQQSQVGFFIASYKPERRLNFISQVQVPNGQLPEGLYQMISVQEATNRRLEKWKKLGDIQNTIEIIAPAVIRSIPGMGAFAPRIVSNDQNILEALALQKNIRDIVQKTEDTATLHSNSSGSVIVLGPTGSGKTTFIHSLAGDLHAQEDQDGYLRLHADQPLPGFNIGGGAAVGTTIPNLWFDQANNTFYWDCPGFGDPRGPKEDIINAFAIDKLFQNSSVKVVLATSDFALDIRNQRGRLFFDLLNEMTKLFTDEAQLQEALSLIVTQGGNPQPSARLNTLLREAQQGGVNLNLSSSATHLLSFLQANTMRVSSLPQPQQEGPYPFNRQHVLNCISRAQYVRDPSIDFKAGVSDRAKVVVGDLAEGLNHYLTHYMKTEGAQRLINYCRQKIDAYSGSLPTLRAEFKQFKRTLKTLQTVSPNTPADIVKNPYS